MSEQNFTSGTKTGTIGGTLLIILANINTTDVVKTGVLAAFGAVVSFGVSMLLKIVVRWWKKAP